MINENRQGQHFRIRDSIMSQRIITFCVKKKLHKYCKIVANFVNGHKTINTLKNDTLLKFTIITNHLQVTNYVWSKIIMFNNRVLIL